MAMKRKREILFLVPGTSARLMTTPYMYNARYVAYRESARDPPADLLERSITSVRGNNITWRIAYNDGQPFRYQFPPMRRNFHFRYTPPRGRQRRTPLGFDCRRANIHRRVVVRAAAAAAVPKRVSSIKHGCYSVEVNLPECRPSPRVRRQCRNRAVSTLESVANRPRPKPTACRSLSLSLSLPVVSLSLAHPLARPLSLSLSLVGWPWVAGSYATGIDIPGGQTVNSRLVRTESVVGLHNMVRYPSSTRLLRHPTTRATTDKREDTKEGRSTGDGR